MVRPQVVLPWLRVLLVLGLLLECSIAGLLLGAILTAVVARGSPVGRTPRVPAATRRR